MPPALPPYPAYKETGLPWLPRIPEHWKIMPGKACYRLKKVPNTGMKEDTVLSLSYGKLVVKPPEKLHGLVPASFETYQIVEPNDIICRPTDLQNDWNSLRFGISQHRGIITSAYMNLNTLGGMLPQYGYLVLHTYDLQKVFYGLGSGLRQNLDWRDFKYLPIVLPPLPEQRVIADYLDHADARIRRAIELRQRQVELLEEYKRALIQQAVTGQVDVRTGEPYPAYKDSGVPWLGRVPEHWEIVRLFGVAKKKKVTNLPNRELLSVFLHRGVIPFSDVPEKRTNPTSLNLSNYQAVDPGDFVLNNQQAWRGSVGISNYKGIVSPAYIVLSLNKQLSPIFANYLFQDQSMVAQYRVFSKGVGSIQRNIYWDGLKQVIVPIPPLSEQRAIACYLDEQTAKIDAAIAAARRSIELLREYRTRLIADVVTGQVDVREVGRVKREG